MSFSLQGVGVSRGVAIGKVHILERHQLEINEYNIESNQVNNEVRRFQRALTEARQQLRSVRMHIPRTTAGDIAAFIDTHLLMLEDSALTIEPARLIRELKRNAEWALKLQRDALVAVFEEMEDPYLRTRKDDVDHVVNRIQRNLMNHGPLKHEVPDSHLSGYIVLADNLSPADTVMMQHHGIVAFATEYGGPTSHSAILARSLGIPSIVGLHRARRYIRDDDMIIVDGNTGVIIVEPDETSLDYYHKVQKDEKRHLALLSKTRGDQAITLDGVEIELHANIELPTDISTVKKVGATGIGLYRTEFMYMNRESPPDEEEHYETYTAMLKSLRGIPVTIRTLDLGGDKQSEDAVHPQNHEESNPALGLRGIRLCLKETSLFLPQLRAIIRASVHGPIRIMVPMVSSYQEMRQVKIMIKRIQEDFTRQKIKFDPAMPLGTMIEVPAAALCADIFAQRLDFLSIGTNDLIQYTMAIDRINDEVNYLYDPLNRGVLRLIRMTLEAGAAHDTPVSMCGEMAGDLYLVRLLLGLGLRRFSVHPASLLEVKDIVNRSHVGKIKRLTNKAMKVPTRAGLEEIIEQMNNL